MCPAPARACRPPFRRSGRRDKIIVYTLYNFTDIPDDFLGRVIDPLSWGATCYPMRYEPLNTLTKNRYVSPQWTMRQVEMVARASLNPFVAILKRANARSSPFRPGPHATKST